MKEKLKMVIAYLDGKLDIYDGEHDNVVKAWNNAYDEMRFMGYNPNNSNDIKKYIREEL